MRKSLLVLGVAFALGLGLAGCGGSDGANGAPGATGPAGAPGATGPQGPSGVPAIVLTPTTPATTFAALDINATVTSVTIASPPVVNFKMADSQGTPIIGFGSTSKSSTAKFASYPNLAFALAKLVPGAAGTPSKWVNYLVTSVETNTAPVGLSRPGTDNTGTLVDHGDGTYTYTFYRDVPGTKALVDSLTAPAGSNKADLGDLTYDANATHRLTIQISGNAPGTGTNTPNAVQVTPGVALKKPVDVIFDFVPATGQAPAASANRKMVANANCESCHSTLGGLPGGDGSSLDFHGGARNNIEYCVVCHTDQRKYGRPEATYDSATRTFSGSTYVVDGRTIGNVVNFVHKIHVAGGMTRTGYNYANVFFDQGGYSQDIRNCDKCHDSTGASTGGTALPQAALWKTNANRVACGSCHDGINFDTGLGLTLADKREGLSQSTGFFGKAHPDNAVDGSCLNSSCHGPGAGGDPDVVHKPISPPDKGSFFHVAGGNTRTNAAWVASNTSRLPAGAIKVAYEVKEVRLNAGNPQIVFRFLFDGVATPVLDFASAPINPASGRKEMFANFMGAPSAQFVWAFTQDGVTAPADFNGSASSYLRSAWDGSDVNTTWAAGTGADAGYYVVTKLNAAMPVGAVMFYGGIGYSYQITTTLPLTQTNLPAYPVPDGSGLTNDLGLTGGLIVIAPNASKLGTGFTATARRAIVDDKLCQSCHQELGAFTEAVFHGGQRNDGSTCSWCHTPNRARNGWSVDSTAFVHAIHAGDKRNVPYNYYGVDWSKIKYPGVLARCEQCHVAGSYDFSNAASASAAGLGSDQVDKRLARTTATGTLVAGSVGLSPWATPGVDYGASLAATNLVTSPTVTVCSACHDSNLAISHFEVNGGTFYGTRAVEQGRVEQCFVCHATGKLADIGAVHAR